MVTVWDTVAFRPVLSVTFRVTLYDPVAAYVWLEDCPTAVAEASPQLQAYAAMAPPESVEHDPVMFIAKPFSTCVKQAVGGRFCATVDVVEAEVVVEVADVVAEADAVVLLADELAGDALVDVVADGVAAAGAGLAVVVADTDGVGTVWAESDTSFKGTTESAFDAAPSWPSSEIGRASCRERV